jgi:Ca2+-binding RTX toxin-like protein
VRQLKGDTMAKTKTKNLSKKADSFKATDGFHWNIDGLKGKDTIYGASGNDTLHGGKGDDWLYGKSGNNVLFGDDGNDNLYGGVLVGGKSKSTIYGGAGDDTLFASAGGSVLEGGIGSDDMIGKKGKDVFVFRAGDSGNSAFDWDHVFDFKIGKDKIDLSALNGAPFTLVTAYGPDTLIRIDANSDGTYDQSIQVVNVKLTAADIIV